MVDHPARRGCVLGILLQLRVDHGRSVCIERHGGATRCTSAPNVTAPREANRIGELGEGRGEELGRRTKARAEWAPGGIVEKEGKAALIAPP